MHMINKILKKWRSNNNFSNSYINLPYNVTDQPPSTHPGIINNMPSTANTTGLGPVGTTGPILMHPSWTDKEKKVLAMVGFKYNKEKKRWELNLSTTVFISQPEEIMTWFEGERKGPSNIAIKTMKQLKKQLIEKLTAKMILMELIKPHEIKEND